MGPAVAPGSGYWPADGVLSGAETVGSGFPDPVGVAVEPAPVPGVGAAVPAGGWVGGAAVTAPVGAGVADIGMTLGRTSVAGGGV